jgi:hypothetical protein
MMSTWTADAISDHPLEERTRRSARSATSDRRAQIRRLKLSVGYMPLLEVKAPRFRDLIPSLDVLKKPSFSVVAILIDKSFKKFGFECKPIHGGRTHVKLAFPDFESS